VDSGYNNGFTRIKMTILSFEKLTYRLHVSKTFRNKVSWNFQFLFFETEFSEYM